MQSVELPRSAARRFRLILSGILPAGVLALVSACATMTSTTEELPELVLKDDVIELRERGDEAPPNSPGKPRLFILALDGMNRGLLYDMLRAGELPEFAALLGGRSNGAFKHAHFDDRLTATLPSSTAPAWATAMTGAPPAEHGIAGNEFFVRDSRRFAAPIPLSFSNAAPVIQTYTDGYWNELIRVPGVYEQMRERDPDVQIWVSMHQYQAGADKLILSKGTALADAFRAFLAAGADQIKKHLGGDDISVLYSAVDERAVDGVLELLEEGELPDVLTVYLAGTDQVAHTGSDGPDKARRQYLTERLDPLFGRLRQALKESGFLEDCYVVVTSDHGLTEVRRDDRNQLGTEGEDEPAALLRRAGFRPRPFQLEVRDDHDFDTVLAYQGGLAYIYVADRSTCPEAGTTCNWRRPPRYRDDVLALAEVMWRNNKTGHLVPELKDTLDMVLTRQPRPAAEDDLPFQVYVGDGRTVPVGDYLVDRPHPDYVDLEPRLRDLAVGRYGDRAGDVLLIPRNGTSQPVDERYYFGARFSAWHGGPARSDSELPLIVAHPEYDSRSLRETVERVLGGRGAQQRFADILLELRYGNATVRRPSED